VATGRAGAPDLDATRPSATPEKGTEMNHTTDAADDLVHAVEAEADSALGRVNIAIFGATGAGKSSLLNAVFGADVAATGVGSPVTSGTAQYVNPAGTLAIYDGAGFELGQGNLAKDLLGRIKKSRRPGNGLIHIAWYCVNSGTARLEPSQAQAIRKVAGLGIPVVLVLTKVDAKAGAADPAAVEFAEAIAAMDLPIVGGRPVLTAALSNDFVGTERHGLEALLDATYRAVPEAQRVAVAAAQKIDLAIKARYARSWIAGAVAFAGGVGATPIPLADAAVLVPAQAALMAKISAIYDIPKEHTAAIVGAVTGAAGAGGRAAVGSLAKLIPGVGNLISGSVAATITGVMGEGWRAVSERVVTGDVELADADQMASVVNQFLSHLSAPQAERPEDAGASAS